MKYFALGGLNYPIGRFLPDYVIETGTRLWTNRAIDTLKTIINNAEDDVTLIGFSKGAQVAIDIGLSIHNVRAVIAHSPGEVALPIGSFYKPNLRFTLISTEGDKLTPDSDTWRTFSNLLSLGYDPITRSLKPFPFQKPSMQERFMQNRCHQFHNAVEYINAKIERTRI
jgi:dienelactone hydrolase